MNLLKRLFPPPSREKFARRVVAQLRKRGVEGAINFDPKRFLIRYGKDSQQLINLGNFYAEYVAATFSGRRQVFDRFMAAFFSVPVADDSLDQVKGQLLPRIRERFYYQAFELNVLIDRIDHPPRDPGKLPLDDFINEPVNEDLRVELVIDLPDAIRTVSKRDLTKWAVSFDDAMAIARENLWQGSNKDFKQIRRGLYVSPWQDTHDASRMFLHDLVWQLKVSGDHVAAIPNRNVLFVTGSEDAEGLQALAKLIDEVMQQPRPMIGQVFRLSGSRWTPFLPPRESPAHWPLKAALMKSVARDYQEQADLLNSLHAKTGEDIFVARQMLMQRNSGEFWTWTSWVQGVTHALMPLADFVSFGSVDDDGKSAQAGFAPWERVMAVAGELLEATDYYPPRYRVRAYPGDDQLAALQLSKTPAS
jgi:hypothetical protein